MPKLEDALYTYLSGDADIAALVGDRIYPARLREGTELPAISYQRVSADRVNDHNPYGEMNAWTRARIQVNCYSPSFSESVAIGEAVLAALSGYSDSIIGSSFAVNEFDSYEVPWKLHRRVLDFFISYEDDVVAASS